MKNSWIYVSRGETSRQARVGIKEGWREQHVSRKGFAGTSSMMYHAKPPAEAVRVSGTLVPSLFNGSAVEISDESDPRGLPQLLASNADCAVYLSRRRQDMPFAYRNADADLLYFVHAGTGTLATEYGPLSYRPGDFIYLPKGTTFRHLPSDEAGVFMIFESFEEMNFTEHLQVGRHAPFDPSVIDVPDIVKYDWPEQAEWEVLIKHDDEFTSIWYAHNPVQLEGWKGDLFPHRLNIEDIRPLTSERLHLAPSSWSIYETSGFMLVAFLPMQIVSDPQAEELPDYHRNLDTDEFIFVHGPGTAPLGTIMHFPQGVTHGPNEEQRRVFEELRKPGMQRPLIGLSLDCFKRLKRSPALRAAQLAPHGR